MKKLNSKVFKTIFILLSLFIIIGIVIYNTSLYKNEYDNVKRNISFMEDKIFKPEGAPPEPKDFNNMMIMDYEVYTIKLNNNEIEEIINHSNTSSNFDVETITKDIINKDKGINIGNLYINKYSYNYNNNSIIIINTTNINHRLVVTLIKSIIILIVFEIMIYFISKALTIRINKPAKDAFD